MNNNSIFKKDRQGHIDRWKASGKTQKDYCDQEGFTYSTFCWWVKQSKVKGKNKVKPSGFVPLRVKEKHRHAQLEISVGRVSVKIFA